MIPFFRKIRKKMADDNKPLKYMRYAIGEIVLVVVGILIALSINNWNEDRKLEIVEFSILKGIRQNILMDTIDLNHNIRRFEEMLQRDIIILNYLEDKKPLDSIVEANLTNLWRSNMSIMLHTSYFDEAKNKGLSIISNKSLRDSISRLYEFRYSYVLLVENGLKQYDYLSLYEDLLSTYIHRDPEIDQLVIGENHYHTILNDELFTWKLESATIKMYSVALFYEDAKKAALNVVDQIDNELVKLE